MPRYLWFVPVILLLAAVVLGARTVGWDALALHQAALMSWVAARPVLAAIAFLAAYATVAAVSLPYASFLSLAGGFLFGAIEGTILTVAGATLGATLLLLMFRCIFAPHQTRYLQRIPESMRLRLMQDGFNYLLALRFMYLVPFWLVNLAAAAIRFPPGPFVIATMIGIVPMSFVECEVGSGIGALLAQGQRPDLTVFFAPRFLLPLMAMALLVLMPVVLRRRWDARV